MTAAIRGGMWQPVKRGKQHATMRFDFGRASPVNGLPYKYKTADAVFADEPEDIFVVT